MKFRKVLHYMAAASILFAISASSAYSQQKPPRQETLLNGLKVFIFNDPSVADLTVKLRVHAGSAFDPQGKEGTMKMLAESIFLTDDARQYFAEDLGGSFEVVSNYDYIQLNITARNDAMIDLLETLANAVSNPQLEKETTDAARARVQGELAGKLGEPAYHADRISAERLFGSFPYGRPQLGTTESLGKIDFADLRFANSRFFGADNAAITIHGNIEAGTAYRAVRRFFGAWLKSDRRVPATFRQPDTPDTSLHVMNIDSDAGAEVRHAIRGYSKADVDFPASEILTAILDTRLKNHVAKVSSAMASVRNEAYLLPGQIVFSVSGITPDAKVKLYPAGESVDATALVPALFADTITPAEFQSAKAGVVTRQNSVRADEMWLNAETYKLTPVAGQVRKFEGVTLADVQKLAVGIKARPAVSLWMVKGIGSK